MSAAISIENGEMALLCFPYDGEFKNCEVFNSTTSKPSFATRYRHRGGKLGNYRGKPTTVGSSEGNEKNKVETLTSSGWITLIDFPKRYSKNHVIFYFFREISYHVLMGLPSGSLLLAGGYDENDERQRAIWLLENDIWEPIGDLEYVNLKNRNKYLI